MLLENSTTSSKGTPKSEKYVCIESMEDGLQPMNLQHQVPHNIGADKDFHIHILGFSAFEIIQFLLKRMYFLFFYSSLDLCAIIYKMVTQQHAVAHFGIGHECGAVAEQSKGRNRRSI